MCRVRHSEPGAAERLRGERSSTVCHGEVAKAVNVGRQEGKIGGQGGEGEEDTHVLYAVVVIPLTTHTWGNRALFLPERSLMPI